MLNNKAVVLDYGHGGTDSGAVSGNFIEKVMNLKTGKSCKEELERHGIKVYETRTLDQTLSISQRANIANQTTAKWFISIHHNAGNGDRGEVIHSILNGEGRDLANKVSDELKAIGQTSVKVYSRKSGNTDYYGVIRQTTMKAIIVETCFIDNKEDVKIADTDDELKRNGIAIAKGILKQIGVPYNAPQAPEKPSNSSPDKMYVVSVGAYNNRENADKMIKELEIKGYKPYITIK